MPDIKISQLPAASPLDGTETLPVVQGAATKQATVTQVVAAGGATYVPLSQRGAANGVATLDAGGTVPDAQIPAAVARDAEVAAGYQPLDADLTTIAGLETVTAGTIATDGAGWIRKTYAQLKTALGLVKADVGLGNVDNTSDAAKPVSTAQQAALDLKAPIASPALTGNPTAPTPLAGDNDTSIATTAFTAGAVADHGAAADPHVGYVLESLYDADTILKADADNTPAALPVGASTLVGRAAAGGIAALSPAQVRALLGVVGDWTDLGNLGPTETITGADDTMVRRKGTLDQACTITLTLAADQQIDLVLTQDGTGGRAATFTGVGVWMTQGGTAPVLTGRAALAVDRFYFENVAGTVYGYWLTETISGGGTLTVQDENGAVATGVTQIDFQGLGVTASSGSGEVVVTVPGTASPRVTTPLSPSGAVSERYFRHYLSLTTQNVLASGRLSLYAIELLAGQVVNSITFLTANTPAMSGATNQWFSLWDASRNKLGVTNDDGATAWPVFTPKTLALTAAYTVPTSGLYYLGIVVVATAVPTLIGASAASQLGGIAPILCGTSNTGLTNPASAPATANAITADTSNPWAYVS